MKTQKRSRQRRCKLSRRMKKRGGVRTTRSSSTLSSKGVTSSIAKTPRIAKKRISAKLVHYIQDMYIGYDHNDTPILRMRNPSGNWVEVIAKYNHYTREMEVEPQVPENATYTGYLLNRMKVTVAHPDIVWGELQWSPLKKEYVDTPTPDSIAYLKSLKWLRYQNREGKYWIPEESARELGIII